jgi:hypothetical protein
MERRHYTPSYVGRSLAVFKQKEIDLLRGLPQSRSTTYLLYTVKNVSHDVLLTPV